MMTCLDYYFVALHLHLWNFRVDERGEGRHRGRVNQVAVMIKNVNIDIYHLDFLAFFKTRDLTSTAFDSLIPRSTTRASSIACSLGGPASNEGDANGTNSAFTVRTPSSGVSGNGMPVCTLTPTRTFDLPRWTWADPLAFSISPASIVSGR